MQRTSEARFSYLAKPFWALKAILFAEHLPTEIQLFVCYKSVPMKPLTDKTYRAGFWPDTTPPFDKN